MNNLHLLSWFSFTHLCSLSAYADFTVGNVLTKLGDNIKKTSLLNEPWAFLKCISSNCTTPLVRIISQEIL